MKKAAIVTVSNDLFSDRRVHKTCVLLQEAGWDVTLIGRLLPGSPPLERSYKTVRMKLFFNKEWMFYAELQVRLFFALLFKKQHLLVSNDLDTLLPNFLVSRIRGSNLVYDSHEFFTEVPELSHAPRKRALWLKIEQTIFPRLRHVITVNNSIAKAYSQRYKKELLVVRNIPDALPASALQEKEKIRSLLDLPANKTILIMQGAGINVDRGAEEAVAAMAFCPQALLLIIGSGDVFPMLPSIIDKHGVADRVKLINRIPYQNLLQYTMASDWGLTLDKPGSLNYAYSLPNKVFDYIQCRIPVIGSPLVEIKGIIERYEVGCILTSVTPDEIARVINDFPSSSEEYIRWKKNTSDAALDLTWEKESLPLQQLYRSLA